MGASVVYREIEWNYGERLTAFVGGDADWPRGIGSPTGDGPRRG